MSASGWRRGLTQPDDLMTPKEGLNCSSLPIRTGSRHLADELDAANRERQEIEKEILAEALDRLHNDAALKGRTAVVLASDNWHPGVIGIVASRVVEQLSPAGHFDGSSGGRGRGSGRSIPAFHLYNALAASAAHLVKFGGHQQAAGLTLSMDKLCSFL